MTLNKEKKIQKQESGNKRWQLWYFNISGGEEQREVWQGAKVSKASQLVYGHHQRWIAMIILTMTVRGTMVGSEVCMAVCWFMDNGHHQRWIANIILIMMVVHGHHLTVQKRWINRCNVELDTPIRITPIMLDGARRWIIQYQYDLDEQIMIDILCRNVLSGDPLPGAQRSRCSKCSSRWEPSG